MFKKSILSTAVIAAPLLTPFFAPHQASAATYTQNNIVVKTEERQSAWGPGNAARIADTKFLGPDPWNDSIPFGDIVGSTTTLSFPNPKYGLYKACKLIPFAKCGSQPAKTITKRISTQTGAEAEITTTGRVGLELSYALDAGSVGSELEYTVAADIPARGDIEIGKAFSLNTSTVFVDGSLDSQSPTAEAAIDLVADMTLDVSTRGCVLGGCKAAEKELIDVRGFSKELISINASEVRYLDGFLPDQIELTTPLLNVETSLEADLVTKKLDFNVGKNNDSGGDGSATKTTVVDSVEPSSGLFVELANMTIEAPLLALSATKQAGEETISVDGTADFISLNADLDGLLAYANAIPPLGIRADFGEFISGSLDLIDLEVGPTVGVFQSFELSQSLEVDLLFDQAVEIAGEMVTSWEGVWDEVPDLAIFGRTKATPTFKVAAELKSTTGLDFGVDFSMDILKGNITVGAGGFNAFKGDFGPVVDGGLENPISLGRVAIFDETFALGGFESFEGQAFVLGASPTAVPIPLGGLLLLTGLGMIAGVKRRAA